MSDQNLVQPREQAILVVDDSPVQALALVKMLEQQGLSVLQASSGAEGLALAHSRHPSLVILDIQMPEMDGLEVCQRLKSDPETEGIPVILFTAHAEIEMLKNGVEQGAIDFIPKDAFSNVVMLETLRQLNFLPPEAQPSGDTLPSEDSA